MDDHWRQRKRRGGSCGSPRTCVVLWPLQRRRRGGRRCGGHCRASVPMSKQCIVLHTWNQEGWKSSTAKAKMKQHTPPHPDRGVHSRSPVLALGASSWDRWHRYRHTPRPAHREHAHSSQGPPFLVPLPLKIKKGRKEGVAVLLRKLFHVMVANSRNQGQTQYPEFLIAHHHWSMGLIIVTFSHVVLSLLSFFT